MKRLIRLLTIVIFLLGLLSQQLAMAIVMYLWEQLPGGDNRVISFVGNWIVADDFDISSTTTIGKIEFWSDISGPVEVNVKFYANVVSEGGTNSPGGDPLYTATISSTVTLEDSTICSQPYCTYRHTLIFTTPFSFDPGHYWVSIYGNTLLYWAYDSTLSDGNPKSGYWWNDNWNTSVRNLAFRLLEAEAPPNQPTVALDYYQLIWGWPSDAPDQTYFDVPVMDPEGDSLTISYIEVLDPATEGIIGDGGAVCYGPDNCHARFYVVRPTTVEPEGRMSVQFQYRVNDGTSDSNTATVILSFGDDLPYAMSNYQLAAKNNPTRVKLYGDGAEALIFTVVKDPEHGSLGLPYGTACELDDDWYFCSTNLIYTPDTDFEGVDSFEFVVYDGDAYSSQAKVRLLVAENSPPTAMGGTRRVHSTQPSFVVLEARDPDWVVDEPFFWDAHDLITFVIDEPPVHGTLGELPDPICVPIEVDVDDYDALCRSLVLYTPDNDGSTEDSFTFYVNDAHFDSDPATIILNLDEPRIFTVNAIDDVVDELGCDETHCSLREAVLGSIDGDTIIFDLEDRSAMIVLGGQIKIDKSITILGPGAELLAISGNEVEHYDEVDDGGVFYVGGPFLNDDYVTIDVTISGVTIQDGRARFGGGIHNGRNSTLTLTDCVIGPNNIVTDAGGGLSNRGGDVTLNRSTVVRNHGTGSLGGAGLFVTNGGSITLINSTVTENVTNNLGGGILVWDEGTVNLIHSTVSGNLSNQDYADYSYGGGGGIYVHGDSSVEIQNSIVAGNTDLTDPATAGHEKWPDVYGEVASLGGNLIGDDTGSTGWVAGDQVGTVAVPIDPLLDVLALNEPGTTPTFALLEGSPAIDAVTCVAGVVEDQRGIPRRQGVKCDIGAYEVEVDLLYIYLPIIRR